MCRDSLHSFLKALPKCEHHMHLEGSLSPSLLFSLAERNKISLPSRAEDSAFISPSTLLDRYARFTGLDDFLHYYFIGMSALVHEQDFEDLAWEYCKRAHDDGVVHAEVFFDPQAHTARGVKYDLVLDGFAKGCARAQAFGMSVQLIPCFLRHLPVQDAGATFADIKRSFELGRVGGMGLSSSEKGFPPGPWEEIYREAKELGIRRTAHAGEEGPVEYIQEALEKLDVQRIDHGMRLVEDETLMKEVARRQILVTLCPMSNVKLQCVKSIGELPVRKFLDAGVRFSINSDDPAYFGGYILDNYCAVQEAFALTTEEWKRIAEGAVSGSWLDPASEKRLMNKISKTFEEHKGSSAKP